MTDRFRTGPDWENLRFFAALARHGSLSAAARALGVNHATVARRVAGLEAALESRLVLRQPEGYALTAAGQAVLETAAEMEAAAERLARQGSGRLSGLVRVAATPGFAVPFLVPELAGFAARHPGLDIELVADLRLASLARRQAELALRYGPVRDSELIAREVARVGFGFYADADWAARIAEGAAPVFVGFDAANAALPEAEWLARHFPRARIAFRANGHLAQAAAAAAGAGVALLPRYLGEAEAALLAVPLGPLPPARSLSLLVLRSALAAPAVRAVRDHLVGRFAARDWLGRAGPVG